jgi:hypothetical protein
VCQANGELFGQDKAEVIVLLNLRQWRDAALEQEFG